MDRLPGFLEHLPVATINYRWLQPEHQADGGREKSHSRLWPTPIHDAATAFSWLSENFTPERNGRRSVYAYGSFLGASLATSLALTESHAHSGFSIRGLIALNGIYNWTMFLPDHPINRKLASIQHDEGTHLHDINELLPRLFDTPDDMFDPFASPSLFFHNPGLLVPREFGHSAIEEADQISAFIEAHGGTVETPPPTEEVKQPRKSHLIFPPRKSTLKLPQTLLLHNTPQVKTPKRKTTRKTTKTPKRYSGNSFAAQAAELAELMRRSVDVVELKERSKWDEDMDGREDEAERRVQVLDIGPEIKGLGVGDSTQAVIDSWLQNKA